MNKVDEINIFLNKMFKLSKEKDITSIDIYYNLLKYNIEEKELNVDFLEIISYFNKKRNINVYIKDNYPFFLNLTNNDTYKNNHNYIKLNLTINKNLNEIVIELFNFLEEKNIKHSSKVSKNNVSNNIIIRLRNKEDVELITSFIKNNKLIQNSLISSNPFSYSKDKILYQSDGLLSYNKILSEIIANYINHINNSNIYTETSLQSFRLFLNEVYQNYFINKKDINILKDEYKSNLILNNKFSNEYEYIANYMEIIELISSSMNPNNNIDNFYNHYNIINNNELKQKRINSLKYNYIDINKILNKVVIEMIKKNGQNITILRLKEFIKTKNILFLNKKVRELLIDNEEEFYRLIKDEDIEDLVNNIKNNKLKERNNKKEECLLYVSKLTYKKYVETNINDNQLICALMNIKNNDYTGFTKTNGARQILSLYIKPEEIDNIINNILKKNDCNITENDNIYQMFNKYIKECLDNKEKNIKRK